MKNPYDDGSVTRFWSSGVRTPLEKNFNLGIDNLLGLIDRNTVVCAAGSCFAQHIGKNLVKRKFKFLISEFAEGRQESFGLGNIYTTRQMKQWLEFCSGGKKWSVETLYKTEENQFLDYLIPKLPPVNSETDISIRRENIASEFLSQIEKANIFIFTCGLTEQWETKSGEALAVAPGTLFGTFDSSKHHFTHITYENILDDLISIENLICKINPKINFIYTVSPVPLTATADKDHVLIATSFSKSKLRAAVGEYVKTSTRAHYFPSYELITHNTTGDWRFQKNLRSVSDTGVDFVMCHAFDEKASVARKFDEPLEVPQSDEVFCEEQKLETFNRMQTRVSNKSSLFLIGDSHMGKLAESLARSGKTFHGGQIMNGSGFSGNKFELDDDKIFKPTENKESFEIWEKTFEALERNRGRATIYTNIGFQTHCTIPEMCNFFNTILLQSQNIADYYSEFYTNTLTLLARLNDYGTLTFVADPNIYAALDEHPQGQWPLKVFRLNFPVHANYMQRVSSVLNGKFLSNFDIILPEIYKDTGTLMSAVGDSVHASNTYYDRLASEIN